MSLYYDEGDRVLEVVVVVDYYLLVTIYSLLSTSYYILVKDLSTKPGIPPVLYNGPNASGPE
jgi:hypothetical protein